MGAGRERSTGVPELVSNVRIPVFGLVGKTQAMSGARRGRTAAEPAPTAARAHDNFAELGGKKNSFSIFSVVIFFGNDIFVRMFLCFFLSRN